LSPRFSHHRPKLKTQINLINSLKKLSSLNIGRKAFLFLFAFVIIFACKDDNEIGLNVLPPSDQIGTDFTDTATVISSTALENDSFRTDELSLQLLGSDNDPLFGRTTASIYLQPSLEGTPAWGTNIAGDSLVLSLVYYSYYGDTAVPQTFTVYQMTDMMNLEDPYYATDTFATDQSNVLATWTDAFRPTTIATVNGSPADPQIRIHLADALRDTLINRFISGTGDIYSSNDNWINYFKGLFIRTTDATSRGGFAYLYFYDSYMTLYFHDTTDTTKKYNYNFSLKNARMNNFNYSPSTIITSNIGVESDSVNYLLAMGGLKTKISFPFLKHFTDSGRILVNRAELLITTNGIAATPRPSKLILVTKDDAGNIVFPDDYYTNASSYGGGINSTGDGYSFNITRHIQHYLDGGVSNTDFILAIAGGGVEATRTAIASGANPDSTVRMKLKFSYTKIK
jgi:hypothetical protein